MADYLPPSAFLNPLGPVAWGLRHELGGAKIVADKAREIAEGARGGAVEGAKEVAAGLISTAAGIGPLSPLRLFGNPLDYLPDLPDLPDLKDVGKDINALAQKALYAELILVGGTVAVVGIAAWFFSRSPEARQTVWSGAKTGARLLVTKGRG